MARHRSCLRTPEPESAEPASAAGLEPADGSTTEPAEEPVGKFAERTRQRHALVHDLLDQGHSLRGIVRELGWGRHTVQRYARARTWREMVDGKWKIQRVSKLDPFKPYLRQRCEQGCTNATRLYREVTDLGFRGSYSTVSEYVAQYRTNPGPIVASPPTVRQVTGWLARHPDTLTEDERPQLSDILERCPSFVPPTSTSASSARCSPTVKARTLPGWIAAVQADDIPGLTSFATALLSDIDAVPAG